MLEIYFERKEKYSIDEANAFFEGIDKINKYLLLITSGYFSILFLIGYICNHFEVKGSSIFVGAIIMTMVYAIQCSKLSEILLENEVQLAETITAETLASLIKNENINIRRKKEILILVSRRKLDYLLTMHIDERTKFFIEEFIKENYKK